LRKLREDEKNAKNVFDKYLRDELRIENPQWVEDVPQDPPDCLLTIGDEVFAVEITAIVEKIETPRGTVARKGVDDSAEKIIAEVQNQALAEGILKGTYQVTFAHVMIDFYPFLKQIKKELLDFIRNTHTDTTSVKSIRIEHIDRCSIQKTSSKGARVVMPFTPFSMKWEGDVPIEACKVLNERITEKAHKIWHSEAAKILILISENPFLSMGDYRNCLHNLADIDFFHTIFICFRWKDSFVKDQILHTINPNWMR